MTTPRFSVIMAAYNANATIGPAIRSALLQTLPDLEVVVVDDGSKDGTSDVALELARLDDRVRVFRQANGGPSAARNRATTEARGEILAFLDADDYLVPEYLAQMARNLDSHPEAGLAYTDAWVLDDRTGRIRRTSAMANQHPPAVLPPDASSQLRLLLKRNFVFFPSVRRQALDDAGPWHTGLTAAEDYELWLRVVACGYQVVPTAGRLAIHREMAGSNSDDLPRQLTSMREVYRLVAEEWAVDDETRVVAAQRLRELDGLVKRFDPARRDPREIVMRPLRRVRAATLHRRLWLDDPPPAVAAVLESAGRTPASTAAS